jgi:hypothetical protein
MGKCDAPSASPPAASGTHTPPVMAPHDVVGYARAFNA